jgi:hypothetical protein
VVRASGMQVFIRIPQSQGYKSQQSVAIKGWIEQLNEKLAKRKLLDIISFRLFIHLKGSKSQERNNCSRTQDKVTI